MEIPKWISPETVAQAKSVNLYEYMMRCEPQQIKPKGAGKITLEEHGSMTIEVGTGVWIRNKDHEKGKSAVDYLMHVRGMAFKEAVVYVMQTYFGGRAADIPITPPQTRASPAYDREFVLPARHTTNKHVISYLAQRGVDMEIVQTCIEEQRIYESIFIDQRNRVHHNCVFVGFDTMGQPRCATMRGTYQTHQFRRDVTGSDKRFYFSLPAGKSTALFVTEGAIDALAKASLIKHDGGNWRDMHLLPLGGVGDAPDKLPRALEQYLQDFPHITDIFLGFDNDGAGKKATQDIMGHLQDRYSLHFDPPAIGKDYGDTARALLTQEIKGRAMDSAAFAR